MRLEVGKCYRSTVHDVNGEPRLCFEVTGLITSVLLQGLHTAQLVLWRHQVLSWHERFGGLDVDGVVEISVEEFKQLYAVINHDRDEAEQQQRMRDEEDEDTDP